MFWGLVVQPNKKYSKTVSTPFHVSQAVLDVTSTSGDSDVQLILKSDKVDYILCILNKSGTVQVPLNLIFSEGDEIAFRSVGGTVHLTGFLVDDQNYPELDEAESSDEEIPTLVPIGKRKNSPAQNGDVEDEVDSADEDGSEDDDGEEVDEDSDYEEVQESEDEVAAPPPPKVAKTNGEANGVSKKDDKQKKQQQQKQQKQQKLAGGVLVEDIREGKGAPVKPGKKVQVYYEGRFKSSNKVFDKSTSGKGFEFVVGRGSVIKGWDVGVLGMKAGGKRRITCPPAMAYGAKGSPPAIPANSTLVFDVEIKAVH